MPILPLPQFEADLAEYLQEKEDREAYERLNAPTTMVVRFGVMKRVGEFPYQGDQKPGCGSKIVVKTDRGVELGEMLTSTCPNAGCSKSVTRQEMLEYIENSGGKDYPFFDATRQRGGMRDDKPRVVRIATPDDLAEAQRLEQARHGLKMDARRIAESSRSMLRVVDAEPILGREVLTIYVAAPESDNHQKDQHKKDAHQRDAREHVQRLEVALNEGLETEFGARIACQQVGSRDEARITADYERCGQHCCCKSFLKVLKPVSMRSAKVQKATLDPLKISGRCGRLMCCLRYEDQTYAELRKRLPNRKKHVGTPEGNGIVIDSQILTQLVLVKLDATGERVAIPVENLTEPSDEPTPERRPRPDRRPRREEEARTARPATNDDGASEDGGDESSTKSKRRRRRKRKKAEGAEQPGAPVQTDDVASTQAPDDAGDKASDAPPRDPQAGTQADAHADEAPEGATDEPSSSAVDGVAPGTEGPAKKKRRRRRRRNTGDAASPAPDASPSPGDPGDAGSAEADRSGPDASSPDAGRDLASPGPDGKPRRRRRRRKPKDVGGADGAGPDASDGPRAPDDA